MGQHFCGTSSRASASKACPATTRKRLHQPSHEDVRGADSRLITNPPKSRSSLSKSLVNLDSGSYGRTSGSPYSSLIQQYSSSRSDPSCIRKPLLFESDIEDNEAIDQRKEMNFCPMKKKKRKAQLAVSSRNVRVLR